MNSSILYGDQANQLEELYDRYLQDPHSVSADWARFFEELSNGRISSTSSNGSGPATQTGSALASMAIYIVMSLVLIWRPSGLFGVRA